MTRTITDSIKEAITIFEDAQFTIRELHELVKKDELQLSQVSTCLTRLKEQGIVHKPTLGKWQATKKKKAHAATKPAPVRGLWAEPQPTETEVAVEDLTLEEMENVLLFFIRDYIKTKQMNRDMNGMLQRVFNEASRAKVINLRKLEKEEL